MHTTLDEQTVVTDPRVTVHAHRSAFHAAINRACELDGLPAPLSVGFNRHSDEYVQFRMDDDHPEDVDSWAARLGLAYGTDEFVHSDNGGKLWRSYRAEHDWQGRWHGYRFDVWAVVYLTDDEAAAYRARPAVGS